MASDVDIILEVAVNGIQQVNNLSNAIKQLNKFTEGAANPIKALDARSRALNQAVGANGVSLNKYAKTVSQLASNQAILADEIKKTQKELKGLGTTYTFASGAGKKFQQAGVQGLKAYNQELKKIKVRALVEDIKSVAQESKRLGKDMQFVGRSLIIGLTTPITIGLRQGLQSLVAFDSEIVRLTKVLEGVAPTADIARQKLGETADPKQVQALVDNYTDLQDALTKVSQKFGLARSLTTGLAADFAELGITSTDNIVKLTELTAAAEKLGNMDIANAKELVQSLYFQSVRTLALTQPRLSAMERETRAIGAATAQLNLFNQVENVTALTLRDLGDAFPEVAAAATSFGLSMTEAAAMLAPMKAAGFEIGASANSIKVSLQRVTAPTKQNSEMLAKLSEQYGTHFKNIKGSGLDALQALTDAYNDVTKSAAGAEGAQEMFAKLFGVRQGPRMEVAIQQLALFDSILKDTSQGSAKLAEKQIQNIANSVISASDATLPLIKNFTDIGVLARIATATIEPGKRTAEVEKFGKVTQAQIDAAKKARIEIGKEMAKVTQQATIEAARQDKKAPADLIAQIGTEAGRAMMIQLAGPYSAAKLANQELERSLESLDTKLSIIRNNFKNFAAELLKAMQPAIMKIADATSKLYEIWTSLSPRAKQLFSTLTLAVLGSLAAIGPLVFIIGQARLAFGTVTKVLFSFLPGLKTLSIETLASRSAMLKLSKPLTVVGETIVNTNSKFATFIATIASGNGPMKNFARRFGEMSGILQKTTTAPVPLVKQLNELKGSGRATDKIPGTGKLKKVDILSKTFPSARSLRKAVSEQQVGRVAKTKAGVFLEEATQQALIKKGYPATAGRGPGGRFYASPQAMVQQAIKAQGAGVTSASTVMRGAGGRFVAIPQALKDAIIELERIQEIMPKRAAAAKELVKKGIDFDILEDTKTFKGRQISDKRATDIYRGGARGIFARAAEFGGRTRESITAKVPKIDLNPIHAYKKGIDSAKTSMAALNASTMAATGQGPRKILLMKTAMMSFVKSSSLATKGIKLMKIAMISSGIGVVLLAIGVAVMIVIKALDQFRKAAEKPKEKMDQLGRTAQKIFNSLKLVWATLKKGVNELIRPIADLFANFSGGSKKSQSSAQGLANIFLKMTKVFQFVANVFVYVVEKFIKPWLYMIVNIVAAVVEAFKGNWGKAFDYLKAAIAFAGEVLINVFKIGFKIVLTIAGKFIKAVISLLGFLGKGMVENVIKPFEFIANKLGNLPGVIGAPFRKAAEIIKGAKESAKGFIDTGINFINTQIDSATEGAKNLVDKAGDYLIKKLDSIKKKGITPSKGKVKLFDKDDTEKDLEDTGDTAQEIISNSVGEGLDEATDGFGQKLKDAIKDATQNLGDFIFSNLEKSIGSVVDSFREIIVKQKNASLKVFDQQLDTINTLKKAEESLTKTKEYEQKKRELLEERALNRENYLRNRRLAIYEGRIDDARMLDLEERKSRDQSLRDLGNIEESRRRELAEENFQTMVDTIKQAKDKAEEFFETSIDAFEEAAKKITQFPPRTIEEFADQLSSLETLAKNTATNNGTSFSTMVNDMAKSLVEDLPNKTAGLFSESLGKLVEEAKTKYGLGVKEGDSTTIIGSTLLMLKGIGDAIGQNTTITTAFSGLTNGLNTTIQTIGKLISDTTIPGIFTDISAVLSKNDPLTVYTKAVRDAIKQLTYDITTGNLKLSITFEEIEKKFPELTGAIERLILAISLNTALVAGKTPAPSLSTPTPTTYDLNKGYNTITGGVPSIDFSNIGTLPENLSGILDLIPIATIVVPQVLDAVTDIFNGIDLSGLLNIDIGGFGSFATGGLIPGVKSSAVPILAHGGEFVINSKAVENVGLSTLQQINNLRFRQPSAQGSSVGTSSFSEQNINIYVDNFIGQKSWFESMMKEYNLKVVPANEKTAGLQSRTISTYTGINRG